MKSLIHIFFHGRSHFKDDGIQNYLMFQPVYRCLKKIANTYNVSVQKLKGLSVQSIKLSAASFNGLAPLLNHNNTKSSINFDGSCLKKSHIYT